MQLEQSQSIVQVATAHLSSRQVGDFFKFEGVGATGEILVMWLCHAAGRQANPPVRAFAKSEQSEDSVSLIVVDDEFSFLTCYEVAAAYATFGVVTLTASQIDGDEDQGGKGTVL